MKKFLKILFLLVIISLIALTFENHTKIEMVEGCQESMLNLDSLCIGYPSEVEEFISLAVRFYPELSNTKIEVRFKNQSIAHTARPDFFSILDPTSERKYHINISQNLPYPIQGSLFKNLSDSAKVGVLAHELAHIVDYEARSSFEILVLGLKYLTSDNFVRNYERSIDTFVINRCAGDFLKSWSKTVSSIFELDGRAGRYLNPDEIDFLMQGDTKDLIKRRE